MKKNNLPLFLFCRIAICLIIVIETAIGFSGCGHKTNEPVEWINLTVKFKANTSEAIMDASLAAIEKALTDTIKLLNSSHPDFHPSLTRVRDAVGTPNIFSIIATTEMATSVPVCLCKTDCKICKTVNFVSAAPRPSTPEFAISDVVESIEPKEGKQK